MMVFVALLFPLPAEPMDKQDRYEKLFTPRCQNRSFFLCDVPAVTIGDRAKFDFFARRRDPEAFSTSSHSDMFQTKTVHN